MHTTEIIRKEIQAFTKSRSLVIEILGIFALIGIAPILLLYLTSTKPEFSILTMSYLMGTLQSMPAMLAASCGAILTADIFAGEMEKKTLETLLVSPVKENEIYLGKITAVFIPLLILGEFVFALSTLMVYYLMNTHGFQGVDLQVWYFSGAIMTPLSLMLSILVTAIASTRIRSAREASLALFIPILPLVAMSMGSVYLNLEITISTWIMLGLIIGIANITLYMLGASLYKRQKIIVNLH